MTSFSNSWNKDVEKKVMKALKNAPHPKGSGGRHPKVLHKDYFPFHKPGEGGFDMTKKSGPRQERQEPTSDE